MEEIKLNTALAIAFVAFAGLVIGGLTVISPTTIQSASAAAGSGGRECSEFEGAERCVAGGGGSGTGGGGFGGSGEIIVCNEILHCDTPFVAGGGGSGTGGGGGGGINTDDCTTDANGDLTCETAPGGGGGGVGGGGNR